MKKCGIVFIIGPFIYENVLDGEEHKLNQVNANCSSP